MHGGRCSPPLASWQEDKIQEPVQTHRSQTCTMSHRSPLKVALLGAGGFVKDAYLEPLSAHSGLLLVTAAWSRSERSATELVQAVSR